MRSHSLVHARPPSATEPPPSRHAGQSGQVTAGLIGRSGETAGIISALRRPGSAGAVVVGSPGIGKTALLHHVQRSLPDTHLVRVRGLRSTPSSPYGALRFLLSDVPGTVAHPALAGIAVADHLRQEAAGRRIVFAIDDAEYLDSSSSTLIGQLVGGRVATAVMTVTDFAQADPIFMNMWINGSLQRFDLAPLSFDETSRFVESQLGAPVSREGVEALWSVGGGNPQSIRAVLGGLVHRGVLARRGSAWVLLPGRSGAGREVAGASTLLGPLTPDQRAIVHLVSLAGALEWSELAQLAVATDLDALQDSGILTIDAHAEPGVRLSRPGLSAAVADGVGLHEAAALYHRLEESPSAIGRLTADPARHAGWRVRAGLPVSEDQAVAAAAALNDEGLYAQVARLADDLPEHRESDPLLLHSLVAALGQGRFEDAVSISLRLSAADERLDRRTSVLHAVEESRLRRSCGRADAAAPLEAAARKISGWLDGSVPVGHEAGLEAGRLHRRVEVARAELASFEGRYRENLERLSGLVLPDLPATADQETREEQLTLQSLLLEACVTLDHRAGIGRLAQALARDLVQPGIPHRVADAALIRVGMAFLTAGGWTEDARPLEEVCRASNRWSFRRGSLAQLAEGLVLMGQDRTRDAADRLGPVVEQLRIADPHGLLPLAVAVLTYCHTLANSLNLVATHRPLTEPATGSAWVIRRAARHYQVLSSSRSGSRAEAARRMHEQAAGDLRRGADSWALMALASAVRLGRAEAVPELNGLARTLSGPRARTYSLYSQALLDADPALFVEAMECAAAAADFRLVTDIAQAGSRTTERLEDKAGLRTIERRLRELLPERLKRMVGAVGVDLLTARERDIAALAAAGHSNRAIAQSMFVSVRTVEGHLYQVYSKLKIRTRTELAALLPMESGS